LLLQNLSSLNPSKLNEASLVVGEILKIAKQNFTAAINQAKLIAIQQMVANEVVNSYAICFVCLRLP
jgi:hypothetical protein